MGGSGPWLPGLSASRDGGRASRRSRRGGSTAAGGRANRAPPGEAEEEPELRAEGLGPAEELARRACRQPAEREQRAVSAHETRQRAALLRLHPSPAAQLQDRCELEQPARVHEVGEPPQPDAVAQRPAPAAEPVAELRHPVRGGVSEHRLTVLDVVVERERDKRHVAERESGEAEPVVVEVVELPGRERKRVGEQLAPEQGGRARDRVRHQHGCDVVVVVAAFLPVRVREHLAVLVDDAGIAVHELRVADLAKQDLELVVLPAVVLVGERHEVGRGRRERHRSLEVPVEADPLRRAGHDEPRIGAQLLLHLGEALRTRAVVAHHADPVAMGLGADRLDLAAKQRERGLVRRHADCNERSS